MPGVLCPISDSILQKPDMAAIVDAGPGQDRVAHPVSGAGVVARGVQQHATWAQRLGSSILTRLYRNVLEIVLDKDECVMVTVLEL